MAPLEHPTHGGDLHEASSRVHSRSPITQGGSPPRAGSLPTPTGLLLACVRQVERQTLGFPPSFAPRSYPRRTSRRRRAIRTGPSTTPSASAEPPTAPPTSPHAPSRRT